MKTQEEEFQTLFGKNKIKYEANRLFEDIKTKLLPQIENEIKLFFDAKSTDILGKLPTRMDEKITVIEDKIIKYIENHASSKWWLKSVFNSRWWPKEEKRYYRNRKHSTKRNWNYVSMTIYKTSWEIYQKNMSCGYPRYAERNYGS